MNNFGVISASDAVLALRKLFISYGYLPYKMGKFEEYDFYVANKDFLTCDSIITFNDSHGRLMALKPDVTLSIVKNYRDTVGSIHKVCYNESVFRTSSASHEFKEMMQSGIECLGQLSLIDIAEVIQLAARSLDALSEDFTIEISHMGLIDSILCEASTDEGFRKSALSFIAAKNKHDLIALCNNVGVSNDTTQRLCALVDVFGDRSDVLCRLGEVCTTDAQLQMLNELRQLSDVLDFLPISDSIVFDFSVINDMKYYNGFVFNGYIKGVNEVILFGGQYDGLMRKFGKSSGAIGFAIYPDLLEQLKFEKRNELYDFDTLLVYPEDVDIQRLLDKARTLRLCGKSVSMQRSADTELRYRDIIYLNKEGERIENDC